jgi:hypothetical protein
MDQTILTETESIAAGTWPSIANATAYSPHQLYLIIIL